MSQQLRLILMQVMNQYRRYSNTERRNESKQRSIQMAKRMNLDV